jgi:hypothetical protein
MTCDCIVIIHSEHLLIQELFIQNNISHEKREQSLNFPHSYPEGSGIRHSGLSVNVCFQHRILGFANGATVKQLLAFLHELGICDHQDASSEGQKD